VTCYDVLLYHNSRPVVSDMVVSCKVSWFTWIALLNCSRVNMMW